MSDTPVTSATSPAEQKLVLPESMWVSIENLEELLPKVETWPRFRKTAITSAVRMTGPFTVQTSEGPLNCKDGWVAVDARGYPYPIADDEFKQIYVPADDDDENIYFAPGVTREGVAHVLVQWGPQVEHFNPDTLRVFAMNALETAELAEGDALLYRWLQSSDGVDPERAVKLLHSYQQFRATQDGPPVEPATPEPS